MRIDVLSKEYPPEVYGGAGVHLEYLTRDLRALADVRVHCFGAARDEPGVTAYPDPAELAGQRIRRTLPVVCTFTAGPPGAMMPTDAHNAGREERRAPRRQRFPARRLQTLRLSGIRRRRN